MGFFDWFRTKEEPPAESPKKPMRKRSPYAGGMITHLTNDFQAYSGSADSLLYGHFNVIKRRTRDLYRNNDYARRYVNILLTNVIGSSGVRLQCQYMTTRKTESKGLNEQVEKAWKDWGKKGSASVCGRFSFHDLEKKVVKTWATDGEVLIRKVRGNRFKHGYSLQFLDSDLLDSDYSEILTNGNQVRYGVEIDRYERPVAYYLWSEHPDDYHFSSSGRKRVRVLADDIIYIFDPDRAGQTRGISPMLASIVRLHMLSKFEEAELVAARIAACKSGFYTSQDGDSYVGPEDEYGAPLEEVEPGMWQELPPGTTPIPYDPEHPNTAMAEFNKAILRGAASGMGVSYNLLANDLEGVNYSSLRHGTLEDREFFKMVQTWIVDHFHKEVFSGWVQHVIDFGVYSFGGASAESIIDCCKWLPRGWDWIDPLKEAKAQDTQLKNGTTTYQRILANQGQDYKESFEQSAREKELMKDLGLTVSETEEVSQGEESEKESE